MNLKRHFVYLTLIFLMSSSNQISTSYSQYNQDIQTKIPPVNIDSSVKFRKFGWYQGIWTTNNGTPISGYNIYLSLRTLEGDSVIYDTIGGAKDGSYAIFYDYGDTPPGTYNLEIRFEKLGYQNREFREKISINQRTLRIAINMPKQLNQGSEYLVEVIIINHVPNCGNCDRPISEIGVNISGTLVYAFNHKKNVAQSRISDGLGIASFVLSPSDTAFLQKVESIVVEIEKSAENNPILRKYDYDLPSINSGDKNILEKSFLVLDGNRLIRQITLVTFASVLIGVELFRRARRKRMREELKVESDLDLYPEEIE